MCSSGSAGAQPRQSTKAVGYQTRLLANNKNDQSQSSYCSTGGITRSESSFCPNSAGAGSPICSRVSWRYTVISCCLFAGRNVSLDLKETSVRTHLK